MRVMVIMKANADSEAGKMPGEQVLRDMGNFNEELVNAGIMEAGEGLHPSSKGVRIQFSGNGQKVVNGPFAATNELVAGFWLWKVKSMDDAIAWAKRIPNPDGTDFEVELRPAFETEDFGDIAPDVVEQENRLRAQLASKG